MRESWQRRDPMGNKRGSLPCRDDVDLRYAYYLVKYVGLNHLKDGTSNPTLSRAAFGAQLLPLPAYSEQIAISEMLAALDDKVDLNRRMNETLEGIVRLVFDARFAQGGWSILGEVTSVLETGKRPAGGAVSAGVPSIGAESITRLGQFDFSKTKFVPRDFFDSMPRGRVNNRDVLLYKDGGRPGEFEPHVTLVGDGFPFDECAINEHVYRIRANDRVTQNFLYFWLTSDSAMDEMRRKGTGVAIPGLNSTNARSISIPVPGERDLKAFEEFAEPHVARILLNARQSRTLAELRETLLPKLLSGDLRIRDAERAVEDAT